MLMTLLLLAALLWVIVFRKSKKPIENDAGVTSEKRRPQQSALDALQRGSENGDLARWLGTAEEKTAAVKSASPSAGPLVDETISVVLRRQIPVRYEEPLRSWLGGLPRMPAGTEWPDSATTEYPDGGRSPLNFVAQIHCADLPAALWGGLGPRSGWLLLFVNGQDSDVSENRDALRVLHIAELGPERQPPPGLQPVHNEIMTGPDYGYVRDQSEIPTRWRRWPIDIVSIPNRPLGSGSELTIVPENFAADLYDGAPVAPDRQHLPSADAKQRPPFTWRGALYVLDSIHRALSDQRRVATVPDYRKDQLATPEWLQQQLAAADASEAKFREQLHSADDQQRARLGPHLQEQLDRIAAMRLFASEPGDILTRIEESRLSYLQWRQQQLQTVADLRADVLKQELDTALPADEWRELSARLDAESGQYWMIGRVTSDFSGPVNISTSLLQMATKGLEAARRELPADYYTESEAKSALIPPQLLEELLPMWRRLYSNRPHRMGGLPDAIQSSPEPGPSRELLLFQITTDDAMNWVWGDAGAYYVFLDSDRLAAGDFRSVTAQFENH